MAKTKEITEVTVTLDSHKASAKSDNIEVRFNIPHGLDTEQFLLRIRHNRHYLRMVDFDRGNEVVQDWPEFYGTIKGPVFGDPDNAGHITFITPYNMSVLQALDWIRKCDPKQVRLVDSQMVIPDEDADEDDDQRDPDLIDNIEGTGDEGPLPEVMRCGTAFEDHELCNDEVGCGEDIFTSELGETALTNGSRLYLCGSCLEKAMDADIVPRTKGD